MRACKLCVNIMSICYTALEKKKKKLNERPRLLLLMSKVSLVFKKSRYNCNSRLSRSPPRKFFPHWIISSPHSIHTRSAPVPRPFRARPSVPPEAKEMTTAFLQICNFFIVNLQQWNVTSTSPTKVYKRPRESSKGAETIETSPVGIQQCRPLLLSSLLFPVPLLEYLIVLGFKYINCLLACSHLLVTSSLLFGPGNPIQSVSRVYISSTFN